MEFTKVSWPSRLETTVLTVLVILMILILTVVIYIYDQVFLNVVNCLFDFQRCMDNLIG